MASPRDILSKPTNLHGPGGLTVKAWLEANADAADFVRAWIEMRREGTTDWSVRRLFRYLRAEHAFPFSISAVEGYLSRQTEAT